MPLIHAAIVLAKAPERYGFTITAETRPTWETVPVDGAWDLRVVAECAATPVETLRELNPELRRLATPADRRYGLRVPPGAGAGSASASSRQPAEKRVRYRTLVVQQGPDARGRSRARTASRRRSWPRPTTSPPQPPAAARHRARDPAPAAKAKVAAASPRRASRPCGTRPRTRRASTRRSSTGSSRATRSARSPRPRHDGEKLQAWNGIKGTRIAAGDVLTIYTDAARASSGPRTAAPRA